MPGAIAVAGHQAVLAPGAQQHRLAVLDVERSITFERVGIGPQAVLQSAEIHLRCRQRAQLGGLGHQQAFGVQQGDGLLERLDHGGTVAGLLVEVRVRQQQFRFEVAPLRAPRRR
ncbi:MAG: hypothetical protein ACOVRP_03470, partial [Gemmatimonas sp.]